jgi:CBS domain-containing protein
LRVERPDSQQTPEAITQASPVGEVARLMRGVGPVTVRPDDALRTVAEHSVAHPECGVLCVTDEDGTLRGLIPVSQLVEDIFVKIVPEEFLSHIERAADALEYAARLAARTAGDIMIEPVSVRPEQTVRDAFRKLHESELAGLPVVDTDGRVTAYLDELELLLVWVEATGRSRLLEPAADGEGTARTDPHP